MFKVFFLIVSFLLVSCDKKTESASGDISIILPPEDNKTVDYTNKGKVEAPLLSMEKNEFEVNNEEDFIVEGKLGGGTVDLLSSIFDGFFSVKDIKNGHWQYIFNPALGYSRIKITASNLLGSSVDIFFDVEKNIAFGGQGYKHNKQDGITAFYSYQNKTIMAFSDNTIAIYNKNINDFELSGFPKYDVLLGGSSQISDIYANGSASIKDREVVSGKRFYEISSIDFDGSYFAVCDKGNNRVLIWKGIPEKADIEPTFVLGQPDFSKNLGDQININTLNRPSFVKISNGKVFISDSGNNRILIWDNISSLKSGANASFVLGQADFISKNIDFERNLNNPTGIDVVDNKIVVADTNNDRLVIFNEISGSLVSSSLVIKNSFLGNYFDKPRYITSSEDRVYISDQRITRVYKKEEFFENKVPLLSLGEDVDGVVNDKNSEKTLYKREGDSSYLYYYSGSLFVLQKFLKRFDVAGLKQNSSSNRIYGFNYKEVLELSNFAANNNRNITRSYKFNDRYYFLDSLNNKFFSSLSLDTYKFEFFNFYGKKNELDGGYCNLSETKNKMCLKNPSALAYVKESVGKKFFIADSGHNRVLGYNSLPKTWNEMPSIILGQNDAVSSSANKGSTVSNSGFDSPSDIYIYNNLMAVVDSGNHRILLYNDIPSNGTSVPSIVLGQDSFDFREENKLLSKPHSVWFNNRFLLVSDSDNDRILIWEAPLNIAGNAFSLSNGDSPDYVLGQSSLLNTVKNKAKSANSLNNPQAISIDSDGRLYVFDANNNRILVWNSIPKANEVSADYILDIYDNEYSGNGLLVVGNERIILGENVYEGSFFINSSIKYDRRIFENNSNNISIDSRYYKDSYFGANGILKYKDKTLVLDKNRNRILVFSDKVNKRYLKASFVIGQDNFNEYKPNKGKDLCGSSSLNSPSYFNIYGDYLYVADSGNNRILGFDLGKLENGLSADLVIGKESFDRCIQNKAISSGDLFNPRAFKIYDGRLFVSDSGHNRILIWNDMPEANGKSADIIIGTTAVTGVDTFKLRYNGSTVNRYRLNNPGQLDYTDSGILFVADSGNNRVLAYKTPFLSSMEPSFVIGQFNFDTREPVTAGPLNQFIGFNYPNGVLVSQNKLMISDQNNFRIFIWDDLELIQGSNKKDPRVLIQSDLYKYSDFGDPSKDIKPGFLYDYDDRFFASENIVNNELRVFKKEIPPKK